MPTFMKIGLQMAEISANKQTNKQTNTQTDNVLYIYRYVGIRIKHFRD